MRKNDIEKSLKRFLKRKVSYSLSILIAFMITGGISLGAGITTEEILSNRNDLLNKIQLEREEIQRKLLENQEKLKELNLDMRVLLKEADFYSKPIYPEYGFMMLEGYIKADSVDKNWQGSVRKDTTMDSLRNKFNEVNGAKTGSYLSSGWINMDSNYQTNTNIYDAESKLFILPVIKAPNVVEPIIPNVSFTVPTIPTIIPVTSPTISNISIPGISVNTPTFTPLTIPVPMPPMSPNEITVAVNEPNINVNVGTINVAGPGVLNIPTLSTPTLNISVPVNLPPSVEDPNPVISMPDSPTAPNFNVYVRKRGIWLYGSSAAGNYYGFNNFDRRIKIWNGGVNNTNVSINAAPFFNTPNTIYGNGTDSHIIATTGADGTVTNKYTNIATDVALGSVTPNNAFFSPTVITNSPYSFPAVIAGKFYSYTDDGHYGDSTDPENMYSNKYQQSWIFQGAPALVKNLSITVGGENSRQGTAIFAQTTGVRMQNVNIYLKGKTVTADVDSQSNYEVNFDNVNIDIAGNYNTILALSSVTVNRHVYTQSTDARPNNLKWGVYRGDESTNNTGINLGTTNIKAETSNNAIFYLIPASIHRWYGVDEVVSTPQSVIPAATYHTNPGKYQMYYPSPGNIKVQNSGTIEFVGSGNAAAWLASYVPDRTKFVANASGAQSVNLGTINLSGDNNVGYYFADNKSNPAGNAVFQGNVTVKANLGVTLDGTSGGTTQKGTGNQGSNSNIKSDKNVAIYVASGQRTDMNTLKNGFAQYYPATLSFTVDNVNLYSEPIVGIKNGDDIGAFQLGTHTSMKDPIKNFNLSDFSVTFGKYSKDSIGVVAKNGTVIDINPTGNLTDNAVSGAESNIMVYAEGVWYNPRKVLSSATYDKEAYGRGESITGQKYISDFNTEVRVCKNLTMGSINSTALFAKSGAKITGKDIIMNGYGSKGVLAHGVYNYASGTIVDSNNTNTNKQPDTTIIVDNITAKANGTNSNDINNNIGAAAVSGEGSSKGLGNTTVTVNGNIDVTGMGVFSRGDKATVNVNGSASNIVSGENGALVAKEGGKINFGGGIITHDVENKLAFFAEKSGITVSNINFTNGTTLNISKGVVFYGDSNDYSSGAKTGAETGRYTGMGNLTVNLTGNGVNLGVFRDIDVVWDGTQTYVNGLKVIPKVAAINTGSYWYKSSLDGGKLSIQTNVDRDNISSGTTVGDQFNDIIAERKEVILESGYNVTSTQGNSLLLGSNANAVSNSESGYTVKGTVDISNGNDDTVGLYTSYGHINVDNNGVVKVSKGVGVYGINGSKIENKGKIEVTSSDSTSQAIGILSLATQKSGTTPDAYGKNAGKIGLWGEVINKGNIEITGTSGIGIYAENNSDTALKTEMTVYNEALIELGDNGKGIVITSNNTTGEGGSLTLKDSGTGRDIEIGKNGIGVYAQGSNVKIDGDYGISIQEGGVALQTEGNTSISSTNLSDKLTVNYGGTSGTGNTAIGVAFKGNNTTDTFNNSMNMTVLNTGGAETIVGIYGSGTGTINNTGNLEVESTGSYGIISDGVDVNNIGNITIGDNSIPVSSSIGIYAKNASVNTSGSNIRVQGNGDSSTGSHPIGIYAKSTTAGNNDINITGGLLEVEGKSGIGVYLEDDNGTGLKLNNASDITLYDSTTVNDRKFGIFMTNVKNTANETSGVITVGGNNIGIYSKDSVLKNRGTINVTYNGNGTENIGIHNVTDNDDFVFSNSGNVNVYGVSNIGISAKTDGVHSGLIELSSGNINVTASSLNDGDIPLGIYASGNNITVSSTSTSNVTVSPNAVGIYIDGDDTSKTSGNMNISLSSDTSGKMGIGAYYKGGSFADNGTMTLTSTGTAISGTSPVRPIGLYYGTGSAQNKADIEIAGGSAEIIGMYGSNLSTFTNDGNITLYSKGIGAYFLNSDVINHGDIMINAMDGYGIYFKGGNSSSDGIITAGEPNSVGAIVSGTGSILSNDGSINATGASSIGTYVENGAVFTNNGTLNATISGSTGSIGAFTKGATIENTGNINSNYLGLYGKDGSTINQTSGIVTVNDGTGILVDGNSSIANLNGGIIGGTSNNIVSVSAINNGTVNLNGTDIINSGSGTIGISSMNGNVILTSGNISITSGTGIYARNSNVNLSGYTGNINIGNAGIAVYSEDSALSNGTLNINYTSPTDKGIGIIYTGTNPITNNVSVNHTGDNLITLYTNGVDVTNTANQTINNDGIGIYGDNGAVISNQGTLALNGDDSIGIYLNGANTTDLGTINGNLPITGYKVGVYVNNGDITGSSTYNFGVDGGVGIYLKNNTISYTGTMNVTGDSTTSKRTIGMYIDPSISGNIGTKFNITGENGVGMYLAGGSNITYNGELNITSASTSDKGIGALVETGSTFTLNSGGKLDIRGTNNIGFYVKSGANLNLTGGTVTNTVDGIFAYLEDGNLHFTSGSSLDIDFANVIVKGTLGNLLNDTSITVGTNGLQGDSGATITNSNTGTISGNVVNAKAMVGTGNGTTVTNNGVITLTGDTSIGMYTEDFAVGTSTGHVSVGDKSAAYYVGVNGIMNISGTSSIGDDSTLLFNAGGVINYTGNDIVINGNRSTVLTLTDGSSLVDFNNKEVTTGINGTGIFLSGTGDISNVINLTRLNVSNNSTGIYMDNNLPFLNGVNIDLVGTDAIGIFTTKDGNIDYSGNIESTTDRNKGIINTGLGNTANNGSIKLTGVSSIGMYAENSTIRNSNIINNGSIEVRNGSVIGSVLNSAVGLYGKNIVSVSNNGNIKVGTDAVGIYGEKTTVTNSNNIISTGVKSTGIYGLQSDVYNHGNIALGNNSNGVFVKNGSITNTGNISVGDNSSSGIYGAGSTNVQHNLGTISVGKESVGIATENGNILVSSGAIINTGTDSTSIYSATGTGTNHTNLILNDHSIGMYTKSGTMINRGNIITGKSTVVTGLQPKISVGMATESGYIENSGFIHVPYNHGVGMVVNDGGTAVNNATIQVDGQLAYGMQATKGSLLENYGSIIIDGANSRGMAATDNSIVRNQLSGIITVNGTDSEGIYVDYGSTAENYGVINVNGAGKTGIYLGNGGVLLNAGTINISGGAQGVVEGTGSLTNVGDITINGPTVSIDGITVTNTGTITINGALDFGTITLGSTAGHIGTINAESFNKGQFIVLPNVTQGSNHEMYTVQYLNGLANVPNNGAITAISHSVSFIADLQKDETDPNLIRVVMVKIPYKKLLANTQAIEFGNGLDEIYAGAANKELEMFDALDMISNKDELGATFDNELRGNVYANIQTRMLNINDVFTTSYETLKNSSIYSRETLKIGAIMTGGEVKDKQAGVEDYDYQSLGTMILKEYDHMKFGRASNWSLGFTQTKFDFDLGSKETVYSFNAGVGFEDYIEDSKNLKYYTRAELSVNHHETNRQIHLSSGTYENTGKFWSGTVEWKNKLRYDIPLDSERINLGVFGTFNLGYGKFEDFKENGDGIRLDVESKDMYIVRPGVGVDVAYNKYTEKGKYSLIGKATAEYELGKVYDGANKAKIKNTSAGYYSLEEPEEVKDILKVGVEIKYETREGHSIGVEVIRQEGSVDATRYGVNLMYRF